MACDSRPADAVQKEIQIIVDASHIINGMKPHMRKTMLERENSDLWEILYREYDNISVKPTFAKLKSHMTAAQAMFRKASIRHILADEGADIAAGLGSDNFATLVKDLKASERR